MSSICTNGHFLKTLIVILLALLCSSCNTTSPSHSASALVPTYHLPDQITLTALAVRDANNGTVIEGTTNLPDDVKLGVELMNGDRATAQDFKVFVSAGEFHSGAFRKGVSPLPPGKQKLHILTYFNPNWQSESVLRVVGKGGSYMKPSVIIHSEDTQLIDGDKILDYNVVLIVPPLAGAAVRDTSAHSQSTSGDRAITLVKNAVLVVDGSRSSETIENGALFFFKSPGVRMGNGWSATHTGENTYRVVLDFINTVGKAERHEPAIWDVDVMTKKVLYRNKNAKNFSWIPKD